MTAQPTHWSLRKLLIVVVMPVQTIDEQMGLVKRQALLTVFVQ